MRHLIKPNWQQKTLTRIVTGSTQPKGAKASFISRKSRAPYIGYAYEGLKHASRTLGFYQDIEPYLPETTIDRYRYKPLKRTAGYLGKAIHKKKFRTSSYSYFYKKYSHSSVWNNCGKYRNDSCESSY